MHDSVTTNKGESKGKNMTRENCLTTSHARRPLRGRTSRAGRRSRSAAAFAAGLVLAASAAFGQLRPSSGAGSIGASSATSRIGVSSGADHIGEPTRAWLELQASGSAASAPQTTLGAEATLAYQRYLDSFRNQIPPFFDSSVQSTTRGSGSGAASGGN